MTRWILFLSKGALGSYTVNCNLWSVRFLHILSAENEKLYQIACKRKLSWQERTKDLDFDQKIYRSKLFVRGTSALRWGQTGSRRKTKDIFERETHNHEAKVTGISVLRYERSIRLLREGDHHLWSLPPSLPPTKKDAFKHMESTATTSKTNNWVDTTMIC